jgi:hypothetical protein
MILRASLQDKPKGKDNKKKNQLSSLIFIDPRGELYWEAKITFLCWRAIIIYQLKELKVCLINLYAKKEF